MTDDRRWQRLRFRSWHRGTREMDLLLGSFADAHLPQFGAAQMDMYEALLELGDPDLYDWITGAATVPPEHMNEVMAMVVGHRYVK